MKIKSTSFAISFLIAITHCIIGSLLAQYNLNPFLEVIFLPYTFIAGLSYLVGWDFLSYFLEFISVFVITTFIYLFVIAFFKKSKKINTKNTSASIKDE
jgi:hypothetical protein